MVMFEELRKEIESGLRVFIDEAGKEYGLRKNARMLFEGLKDFILRDGKRIRPMLFLLGYLGYTKRRKIDRKKLIRSAIAIELLHDFFLIHDDIIDRSDYRRGKLTLHKMFNKSLGLKHADGTGSMLGIAAGDMLYSLSMKAFLSIEEDHELKIHAFSQFINAAAYTCLGEYDDVKAGLSDIKKIKERDVLNIYTSKTARYTFECPLVTGAILAGCARKEIVKISKMAILLGMGFQIIDDMGDLLLTSHEQGKTAYSDLVESKKTLLVIIAFNKMSSLGKKLFQRSFSKVNKSESDIAKMVELITKTNAPISCLKKAFSLICSSKSLASSLKCKKEFKNILLKKIFDPLNAKIEKLHSRL
ncbi:MAG: polyprenyl synthetase family protein [Candidatus Omnitrophica bacterium]|nr:polyprenyl synthetase family protein [Candidatus Omnitrophota bacterium]